MRKLTSADIDRLDSFLCRQDSDRVMLVSELDGLLAGAVVSPELITPSAWMPAIWGADNPVFEDEGEANEIIGLIMARYNQIARSLQRKGKYQPILELDIDEMPIWELWAEGFAAAMGVNFDSWSLYCESDDKAVETSFLFLFGLVSKALDGERMDEEIDEPVRRDAHQLIADCLETLNQARMTASPDTTKSQGDIHVGRNDPCPCGSGKKLKKCCLH